MTDILKKDATSFDEIEDLLNSISGNTTSGGSIGGPMGGGPGVAAAAGPRIPDDKPKPVLSAKNSTLSSTGSHASRRTDSNAGATEAPAIPPASGPKAAAEAATGGTAAATAEDAGGAMAAMEELLGEIDAGSGTASIKAANALPDGL